MLRELTMLEVEQVQGAKKQEYYPPQIEGYEIIGWTTEIIGYDVTSWKEIKDFFTDIEHEQVTARWDIQPIYAPIQTMVIYQ